MGRSALGRLRDGAPEAASERQPDQGDDRNDGEDQGGAAEGSRHGRAWFHAAMLSGCRGDPANRARGDDLGLQAESELGATESAIQELEVHRANTSR
jgi:hypothetical protein